MYILQKIISDRIYFHLSVTSLIPYLVERRLDTQRAKHKLYHKIYTHYSPNSIAAIAINLRELFFMNDMYNVASLLGAIAAP